MATINKIKVGSTSYDVYDANALHSLPTHNHDDRYYTEAEADSRFLNVSGDTMTGDLTLNAN